MRGAVRGASLAGTAAAVAVLASLAANAATSDDRWPGALDRIRQQPWWWVAGLAALGVLVAVVVAWRQERGAAVAGDPPPPAPQAVPDWVVDRGERARTVKAVCRAGRTRRSRRGRPVTAARPLEAPRRFGRLRRARTRSGHGSRTVALTTSLEGAGGFGKTVLAHAVAASPRVRRYFRGRVYTVTIGRDVRGRAAIAAKVAEATRFLTGDTTAFDDPGLAGDHLGRLLDLRPRTLLILDDVWDAEQLEPFLRAGERCVRLVTTRVPGALPRGTERVRVDEMSPDQARAVLTWELPELPETLVRDLLEATGRWALLLRLTNRLITRRIATGTVPEEAAAEALRDLVANGPAVVDADPAALDLDDPVRRARAVRATVEAARTLLPPGGGRRLAELAVFAEDESVPVPLIARLWEATGGLTEQATRSLCGELDRLSLVSLTAEHGGRITMHDVLRDYLLKEWDEADVTALHGTLVDAMGAPWEPAPTFQGYVLDHAIEHLLAAGRTDDAERVASDLRWIETRLHQRGPMAPWADLAAVPTRTAAERADDLTRTAHLLTPTDPPELLTNVLHSRLESLPLWCDRVTQRRAGSVPRPHLRNRRTPPDLPDPALIRTFLGHTGPVRSVAVSPDGSLVTIGADGMARGLDPNSGGRLTVDVRGPDRFRALAISPDGTRLATGGSGRTVHLWSLDRATLPTKAIGPVGDRGASVRALAFSGAQEGGRVVTVATDGDLDVWDAVTGEHIAGMTGWSATDYTCVALYPNGRWLAVGGRWGVTVMSTELTREELCEADSYPVNAVAVAPDGRWVVSAGTDGVLRIWEETTRSSRDRITAHSGSATAVAISPDGRRLVSGGENGSVALWDRETAACLARYNGHRGPVHAVAFTPDGERLISTGEDGTVRIWQQHGEDPALPGASDSEGMRAVTVVGDGRRLLVAYHDGTTRLFEWRADDRAVPQASYQVPIWAPVAFSPDGAWYAVGDTVNRAVKVHGRVSGTAPDWFRLSGSARAVALAVAPDGTWLAVADSAGEVYLWDLATGSRTVTLPASPGGIGRVDTVLIAPDATWLAVLRRGRASDRTEDESWAQVSLLASGAPVTHDLPHDGTVNTLAITPDGTRLLTASATGTVTLWDPYTGTLLSSFTDPDGPVQDLAVSPDGRWIATAGTMLRVWEAAAGRTVAGVRAETPLASCAWLPDGRGLVAVGERGLYSYEFVHGIRP
ncbi:NB-ARC domain-containing protein [Streptomyces sp. NPDC006339]|uniref:NB-ARC domain-containing protein n=1 Tax=Streptomyces sp. NPDC006339 TaxID=3156755 RepID=UPI0033A14C14